MENESSAILKYIIKLEHLLIQSVKQNIKFKNNVKSKLKKYEILLFICLIL